MTDATPGAGGLGRGRPGASALGGPLERAQDEAVAVAEVMAGWWIGPSFAEPGEQVQRLAAGLSASTAYGRGTGSPCWSRPAWT